MTGKVTYKCHWCGLTSDNLAFMQEHQFGHAASNKSKAIGGK